MELEAINGALALGEVVCPPRGARGKLAEEPFFFRVVSEPKRREHWRSKRTDHGGGLVDTTLIHAQGWAVKLLCFGDDTSPFIGKQELRAGWKSLEELQYCRLFHIPPRAPAFEEWFRPPEGEPMDTGPLRGIGVDWSYFDETA